MAVADADAEAAESVAVADADAEASGKAGAESDVAAATAAASDVSGSRDFDLLACGDRPRCSSYSAAVLSGSISNSSSAPSGPLVSTSLGTSPSKQLSI